MMLRKRSRATDGKQVLMPDAKPRPSSLFPLCLSYHGSSDSEAAMSPTSILETKNLSSTGNHFFSDRQPNKAPFDAVTTTTTTTTATSSAIGLGIIDALNGEKSVAISPKAQSRMLLLGSQLKIQIPSLCSGSMSPVGSPIEFGLKNRDSQLALLSPAPASSPRVFTGSIPMSEMELSEDYTCVISHGPNPRTTHIFDNCVVERCGDGSSAADRGGYLLDDFLSYCHACKKNLGQGKDTFMYRGEKAFCSSECRNKEMLNDGGMEKCSEESSLTM
ncbi:FCS-Like Zinc finger 8 isoform X1 [Musa acuminata AAA Group]|uniref:FCS-Like Zinc finger 8 isoform X1 n=1 Tax=Musa acuminata AAA Group TaxID=214697 RepID=UPI0031CF2FE7